MAVAAVLSAAAADPDHSIQVVSAVYGHPRETHPFDFTGRLQELCGPGADYCEAFCSRAGVGGRARFEGLFVHRPVCRVVYRCGGIETRATDADDNDTIILSCRNPH